MKYVYYMCFALLLLSCSEKTVLDKVRDYMSENVSDTIKLANFTKFEWDKVLIADPFVKNGGCVSILDKMDIDISNISKVTTKNLRESTETADVTYFIKENKVVYVDCVPWINKGGIDVWDSFHFSIIPFAPEHYIILSKNDAVFLKTDTHTLAPMSLSN